jgi:hypothetical protein
MAQAKVINIEDAKLKTLTVEIKAMTVNGKQMNMSIFRQLQEANIFDEHEYVLKGIPWGIVRYPFGEYKNPDGFHVVWQQENVLYRWFVQRYPGWNFATDNVPCSEELMELDKAEDAHKKSRYDRSKEESYKNARMKWILRHNREIDQLAVLPHLFIAV